jgi:dTDP-4-amino-4,6-dideoxygalactose transaminase
VIPFVDLKAQYHSIKDEIHIAIDKVLESSQFVLGDEVAAFENEFAAYAGGQYGIGVNSGTSALHIAFLAAGIGPGDEVITTSFTFIATIAAIEYAGARAVLVDIDPQTYTIDVSKIERAITQRTKAIVPVHLYGQAADMDPILEIARKHGLLVIEDAAQAHGAEYNGHRVGSLGDFGCFSFYPGKNLGAYGEGGFVVTNNADYAHTLHLLRNWGEESRYHHDLKAFNYRMEGLQGAILRVKLRYLENWTEARRAHATVYNNLLADTGLALPATRPYNRHVYHIYAIRVPQRDNVQQALRDQGVQTGIHYPIPVHLQKAYSNLGYKAGDFPQSELIAAEILSLPMYAELSDSSIEVVANTLKACLGATVKGNIMA